MTISKIFLYFCLSFVLGIAVSSFSTIPQVLLLGFLIVGISLVSVFWQKKKLVIIGFCLLFLVLGVWRHQQTLSKIVYPQEEEITFIGIVVEEPDVRQTHTKLTLIEASPQSIQGKVLVTASRYPEYQYNDELKITGQIQAPDVFEDFNYQDYLAKDGVYSVMYYPRIEYSGKHEGGLTSFIYGKLMAFKDKLREPIEQNLSPPQSSILAALLLGDKSRMSAELKEKLNRAGVRHITAISGMHIPAP